MSYHREDEVRTLIENYVSWRGDGVVVSAGSSIFLRALNSIRQEVNPRAVTPAVLGIDAGYAGEALREMAPRLRFALLVYYTSSLTFVMQAREILDVSKPEYHRRLQVAHPEFMDRFQTAREAGKGRFAAWARA